MTKPYDHKENEGRRWWRIQKEGEESMPVCLTIAELEEYWIQGYRPLYPIQCQPLPGEDDD